MNFPFQRFSVSAFEMTLPIIIAINGILTGQSTLSWPDQFDAWCERAGVKAKVLKKEYLAGPFPLWNVHVKNRILAHGIAAEIDLLCGDEARDIHFVSHSNGTDIALKAVKLLAARDRKTKTLIVVGSVLPPDIAKTGVMDLIERRQLSRAVCYWSDCDLALRFGRHSFGYSELGRVGWKLQGVAVSEILRYQPHMDLLRSSSGDCYSRDFTSQGFGHGTYFHAAHFESTFNNFRKDMNL